MAIPLSALLEEEPEAKTGPIPLTRLLAGESESRAGGHDTLISAQGGYLRERSRNPTSHAYPRF